MTLKNSFVFSGVCVAFAGLATGCTATDSSTTASGLSSLVTAQCAMLAVSTSVDDCRATYDTCVSADGADRRACADALAACLPAESGMAGRDGEGDGEGDGDMEGGCPRDHMGGGGGPMGGEGHHGHHGRGGPGHHRPPVDDAAVAACRDATAGCVAAGTDAASCLATEHDCVHAAFQAAFEARCAELATTCGAGSGSGSGSDVASTSAPAECEEILARCAEGVRPPPGAPIGTTCE